MSELTGPTSQQDNEALVDRALLTNCVHCGLCLEVCPTYQLSGDENNSPRGRLRLWRGEAQGKLPHDQWTDFYTSECIGCLACEPACPANVPYGAILERVRQQHQASGRASLPASLRMGAALAVRPALANFLLAPARLLRKLNLLRHRFLFPGRPSAWQSTAAYTARLMERHQPRGPLVALLTGCLMESVFRELNFATIRVLVENGFRVTIPSSQTCCGAFLEHSGQPGVAELRSKNRAAFTAAKPDVVLSNSSGCGLALQHSFEGELKVQDALVFLAQQEIVRRERADSDGTRVYLDLPCHLIHGQREPTMPESILAATGYPWELAPRARDCCGSGGTYNLQKPENSQQILSEKAEFLNQAEGDPVVLATSNHVCLMQWHSAGSLGIVQRPYQVRHVIQLLDPGSEF